eukprot:TRINITY_DN6600_c0_g1_i1.p1 TRINITY_DN6600_c0_g1~~TRINITY_DN6600_c0_g1_i1.p1  ORF type:complete len:658 (+),score=204.72 TRINITY_DN6600_c0_g1_i1:66-2039(+)
MKSKKKSKRKLKQAPGTALDLLEQPAKVPTEPMPPYPQPLPYPNAQQHQPLHHAHPISATAAAAFNLPGDEAELQALASGIVEGGKRKPKEKKEQPPPFSPYLANQEGIREFFVGLAFGAQRLICTIDKQLLLRRIREQQRSANFCSVCGRRRTSMEEELERIFSTVLPDRADDSDEQLDPVVATFAKSLVVVDNAITLRDEMFTNQGSAFLDILGHLAQRRVSREDVMDDSDLEYEDEIYEDEYEDDAATTTQRLAEGRRMFRVFCASMFEQRLMIAYREHVAFTVQQELLAEEERDREQAILHREQKARREKEKRDKKKAQKRAAEEQKAAKLAQKLAAEQQQREQENRERDEKRRQRQQLLLEQQLVQQQQQEQQQLVLEQQRQAQLAKQKQIDEQHRLQQVENERKERERHEKERVEKELRGRQEQEKQQRILEQQRLEQQRLLEQQRVLEQQQRLLAEQQRIEQQRVEQVERERREHLERERLEQQQRAKAAQLPTPPSPPRSAVAAPAQTVSPRRAASQQQQQPQQQQQFVPVSTVQAGSEMASSAVPTYSPFGVPSAAAQFGRVPVPDAYGSLFSGSAVSSLFSGVGSTTTSTSAPTSRSGDSDYSLFATSNPFGAVAAAVVAPPPAPPAVHVSPGPATQRKSVWAQGRS